MTRKDYELIASALNDSKDLHAQASRDTIRKIVDLLIPKLTQDNPNFDVNKFKKACGIK